jgi:hypothetical protein
MALLALRGFDGVCQIAERFLFQQRQELLLQERPLLNIQRDEPGHLVPELLAVNDARQTLDEAGGFVFVAGYMVIGELVPDQF